MNNKNLIYKNLLLFGILFIMMACGIPNKTEELNKDIQLEKLIINVDMLPPGWSSSGIGSGLDSDRSSDSKGVTFFSYQYPKGQGCSQDIYRYKSIESAKKDYQTSLLYYGEGNPPSTWDYSSIEADESYFVCQTASNIEFPICLWGARYKNIVIEFKAWLIPDYMTIDDVENVIKEIDKKATEQITDN